MLWAMLTFVIINTILLIVGLIFIWRIKKQMATQEERLRAIKVKMDNIQTGVDKIQQQLADLKAGNPELEDEIAAIEETAAAIDTDVNPPAAPTGGDTGGGTEG